jgi:polygalacturonase
MCENVIIKNVKIFNPWYSQNGDALDVESCNRVLVADCLFDAGDDGICIKSGKDADGRERAMPCSHVVVRNTQVLHGHGGFVVGSEMSGGVNHIYVENCTFTGTDVGLRFKSTRGRGGVVEDIYIENINMCDIPTDALTFNLYYSGKSATEDDGSGIKGVVEKPVTEETPEFRNIYIKNIKCRNANRAMYFHGLPEMPLNNIVIEDVDITASQSGRFAYSDSITMRRVRIKDASAGFTFSNCNAVDTVGIEYIK